MPASQRVHAHRHARGAVHRARADERTQETQTGDRQALPEVLAGEGNDHRKREDRHPEVVRLAEIDRDIRHRAGQEEQRGKADQRAQERIEDAYAERLAGFAPAGPSGAPSNWVATFEAAPGMLSRIAEISPPEQEPI